MSFKSNQEAKPVEMLPGVTRRTLNAGERMTLHEIRLSPGSEVPSHTHPHEQTGYVARGRVRFTVGGEERELGPGDGYHIPGEVPHAVTALEEAVCVDVFSPPRTEYLD
jgi:quercetin dioxygenase-like cupin family protein